MSYRSLFPLNPPAKPLLIVLSGLSGAGKDAVLDKLRESDLSLEFITTVTTRLQRTTEVDDVHYHFVSEEEFQDMIERSELLEWANVYGNYYGVPKKPVKQALEEGLDVVVKVDVQGVANIKKILPQAVFIFLTPPSIEELVQRLKKRRTESPADLELRVQTAQEELKQVPLFDYVVLNRENKIARAVTDIKAIIIAEKCRVVSRDISL